MASRGPRARFWTGRRISVAGAVTVLASLGMWAAGTAGLGILVPALALLLMGSATIVVASLDAGASPIGAVSALLLRLVLFVPAWFIAALTFGRAAATLVEGAHSPVVGLWVLVVVTAQSVPVWAAIVLIIEWFRAAPRADGSRGADDERLRTV